MTNGSPAKLIFQFALPLFLGNLLQQFYNIADLTIAGHLLGSEALAQIGATSALYSLIMNFCFGLNNGFALSVSRSYGRKDSAALRQSAAWMTVLSMGLSIVLAIFSVFMRVPLLRALQVPKDTFAGASAYLTIILAGIPLTMAYNMQSAMLQAIGNSRTPLCFLMFSTILNIILDTLFMGPLRLGIQGAAGATILAQGISALLLRIVIIQNYRILRFSTGDLHTSARSIGQMLSAGLSMAFMSAIYDLGSVVLQGSINALGNIYITAQVGARKMAEFIYTPGVALGTAAATYTSQNLGAGKRNRIMKGTIMALILFMIWWGIAMLLTFTAAGPLLQMITGTSDSSIIRNGALYLKISMPMVPFMAILIIIRNVLQGMQHLYAPLISSGLEMGGKIIFALYLVPAYGYQMVCICEPVTWVACCLFVILVLFRSRTELHNQTKSLLQTERSWSAGS